MALVHTLRRVVFGALREFYTKSLLFISPILPSVEVSLFYFVLLFITVYFQYYFVLVAGVQHSGQSYISQGQNTF